MKVYQLGIGVAALFWIVKNCDENWYRFDVDESSVREPQCEQEQLAEARSTETSSPEWDNLDFGFSGNEIKSIEFETFPEVPEMARNFDFVDRVKASKTVSNKKELLKIAMFSFSNENCLRNIINPGVRGGEGNAYLIGRLTLDTTSGKLVIGVGSTGFSIDGNVPGLETEFYSPSGAELLSMLYCKQSGIPLRNSLVSALNGHRFIEHRQGVFRRLEWTKLVDGH